MTQKNTLTVKNLHCTRGDRTLFDKLNIEVSSGQCLHIMGANGCGKTSLLRILSGLNMSDDGDVYWNQSIIKGNQDYLSNSTFIGHKDGLKNELTAIENLRFNQQLNTLSTRDENQLDDCLNQMQILRCADLLAQQLSFGQRRRLTFAKLLLRPFKIWILDEPFTGIDARGRELIEALLKNHLENDGMIILTHHQSLQQSCLQDYLSELHLESTSGLMPSDKSLGR